MSSHELSIRVSSRSKRPVEKYSDIDDYQKKRTREGSAKLFGEKFFDQLSKGGKKSMEFSPPSDWTKGYSRFPSFRQLKQNMYRAPLCRPCFDEESILVCDCKVKGTTCGSQCHNRMTYVECVPEYCANSSLQDDVLSGNPGFCDNTAITLQRFPKTEVFETADRGYGLRLLVAVPADTIVAEYMGEVISNDAMWQRMKTYQATDDFYFANLGGGLTLDASSMGSLARFANHSCDPTCIMQRWTVKGEPRIVLAALRDLPAGSEVTYCYNFEDDDFANNPVKHQVCRCGAKYCSGKVGKGAATRDADLQSLVDKVKSYSEGSKSGSLETLAELLEQMQKHKSNHIELATSCENLANIISQANGWLDDCQQLMATAKSQLVDITEVTSLLDRSPTCLRSDFKKQLKAMSTAYEEVQGFVSKLLANSFVHWDDFLELCKLLNSAHPVNCKVAVDFLFGAYLPCLQWCAEHVAPFTTCLEEIVSKTAGEGISQHRSNYFSVLKKLMKAYYHDSTLLPDLLTFSVSQLNDRLSDFMKVHYSSKNKAKKDQDEESEVVVCYCQTLESAGDQTVCVQCSTCDQWFHPACMNFPTAYTASMRKQDNFYCAACSFKVGLLSNFVFPPNSEWGTVKLKKKAVQSVASGNHAKSNATSEPLVPLQKLHLAPTAVVKAEGDVAHSSALFDPAAPVAVAPENPLLVALDRLIAQRQHMQHKQFLRKEDINIALRQAESLQLRNNPVSELLALAKKFVSEWEADVAAFLSNDLGSVVAILDRVLKEKTTCCDDMCSLSAHLQRLVGLYFKLLQLRIKPTMLKTLRVWIWTISIVPYVLTHFGYDFSLPHTLPVLQHYQHIRTLSLSDLKKISSAGKHLLADLTDMFVIHGVHIITHKKTVVSIVCALEDAASTGSSFISKCKQCKSAAAAQELQQSVIYISKYLVLHREFYFARLMNLLVVPNPAVSEETSENQAQEVYCWCRQGELLASQMVFCDSCNVWFHYTCMGLLGKKAYGFGLGRQATGLSHSWCMFDPNHDKAGLKKLKSEEEPFLCIRCSEEKGLNYPYAW